MSPYDVVSSYLAVSSLPFAGRFVFCYGIHKITPICAFHSRMPYLSGLSSVCKAASDKSSYLILFISELALHLVILSVDLRDSLLEARSGVNTFFMALHRA